ncbi:MAG: YpdA family putative bacillithiol disulfide reductase [Bacteroidota bacterium]
METYSDILDVLIVGAGPIGLACGIEAKRRKLSYLIVEKGCLVNSIYHYPTNMTFFSTSQKIEIGGVPFVSHQDKPNRREALEYYRRVYDTYELAVKSYERVEEIGADSGHFKIKTSKANYRSRSVVIATGFFDHPNLMDVVGEDLPKVKHYFDDPHPYIGHRVLVVGGANSAIDVALECWRKGAEVSLVHRGEGVGRRVKYWVKPDIENRIKEGSIKAYFQSTVKEIFQDRVILQTPEGEVSVENEFVLAMTGFKPDYSFLEKVGLEFTEDELRMPIRDEETFESNIPNIFLAGTVCGGMQTNKWFIENSIEHASTVMEEIKKRLS